MLRGNMFNRARMIAALGNEATWDIIIIGGGATGLGTALDAASRGFKTLLLEQHDFAKGTSSRSTKLIHGGVRYMAQGDLKLVYSALHERNTLAKNASHIVRKQSFIIPCYNFFDLAKYGAGLKIYDILAGRYSLGRSRFLSRKKVLEKFPRITAAGLKGGIEYFDGQFDDARLAINLAQTAVEHGAIVFNYFKVGSLVKQDNITCGVLACDMESGKEYRLVSKVVINATGVFVDEVLRMDEPETAKLVTPSRGVHLVVNRSYLQSESALMIPKTSDGRVLFAVPWQNHLVVGTTDTPLDKSDLEPTATKVDIGFILENLRKFLHEPPSEKDILSVFAGLRPLAAHNIDSKIATKELSRDHKLLVSRSGLITITGGKWTTYRKMAQDTIDIAIKYSDLQHVGCKTTGIKIHGCTTHATDRLRDYGTDAEGIRDLIKTDLLLNNLLDEQHPYVMAEVVWAVRNEMARTVEDVLARRLRLLFFDADAAIRSALKVAEVMKEELKLTDEQASAQLSNFYKVAELYRPKH